MGMAKGSVKVNPEECKGCSLCVESCPPKCLELGSGLNTYGAHPAHYTGEGCTGCGICFYCCPEPGAITVYKEGKKVVASAVATQEADHAAVV
jgi:NAD-dependent dihydropyrimidine dehydrogenase PreA subunit